MIPFALLSGDSKSLNQTQLSDKSGAGKVFFWKWECPTFKMGVSHLQDGSVPPSSGVSHLQDVFYLNDVYLQVGSNFGRHFLDTLPEN